MNDSENRLKEQPVGLVDGEPIKDRGPVKKVPLKDENLKRIKPSVKAKDYNEFKLELQKTVLNWIRYVDEDLVNRGEQLYRVLEELLITNLPTDMEKVQELQFMRKCLEAIKFDPKRELGTIKYLFYYLRECCDQICKEI